MFLIKNSSSLDKIKNPFFSHDCHGLTIDIQIILGDTHYQQLKMGIFNLK